MDIFSKIISLEKPQGAAMRQRLIEMLCEFGESSGYTVIVGQDVDCEWIKPDHRVAIEVQFGNPGEYYQSLRKLVLSGAKYCVLIMSSKAQSLDLARTVQLLNDTFQVGSKSFLILDIETGRHSILGKQQKQQNRQKQGPQQRGQPGRRQKQRRRPRRKIIYGKPGEHKEQD